MAQISALRFKALIMQGRACHAHSPLHVSPAVRAAPAGRDVGCRACCTRVRVKCSCLAMTTLAGPAIPQQRPTSDRRDRSPCQSAAKSCVHRGCHPSTLPQSRRSFQAVSVYICRFRGMQISDWALSLCVHTRAHTHTHVCMRMRMLLDVDNAMLECADAQAQEGAQALDGTPRSKTEFVRAWLAASDATRSRS